MKKHCNSFPLKVLEEMEERNIITLLREKYSKISVY